MGEDNEPPDEGKEEPGENKGEREHKQRPAPLRIHERGEDVLKVSAPALGHVPLDDIAVSVLEDDALSNASRCVTGLTVSKEKVEGTIIPGRWHILNTRRFAPNASKGESQLPWNGTEEAVAAVSTLVEALGARQLVSFQVHDSRMRRHFLPTSRDRSTRRVSLYYSGHSSFNFIQQFFPRRREILLRYRLETPRTHRRRGLV